MLSGVVGTLWQPLCSVPARSWPALLSLALSCCSGKSSAPSDAADAMSKPTLAVPHQESVPIKEEIRVIEVPAFGPEVLGLWLKRSIVVRAQPSLDAEKLGTAAAHTIVGWQRAVKAEGCNTRWIEIKPRGWVCEGYLEPREKPPAGVELPKLAATEYVPGTYGKIIVEDALMLVREAGATVSSTAIMGSSTVRKRGAALIDGEPYWKIDGGGLIAESSIRLHKPSLYQGARLQDGTGLDLPIGFAVSSKRPGDWVVVRDKSGGKRVQRLKPRTIVEILDVDRDAAGKAMSYRIGEGKVLDAADLRIARRTSPPPLIGPHERWFDIDLDTQVLVAYEGDLPVYATLVSSGTRKNPTETGIFRIWIKFAETNMSGRMGESDAYSVAKVPWTQFYENDFALHTAYWHDRFGEQRSHGCVNLSPRDSRFLYFWSDPQVPVGWSMANGTIDVPGSIVRVRSSQDPEPKFMGYALRVQEARVAAQAGN